MKLLFCYPPVSDVVMISISSGSRRSLGLDLFGGEVTGEGAGDVTGEVIGKLSSKMKIYKY